MSISKLFSDDYIYFWSNVNAKRRNQLYLLLALTLITSIFEILGISAIFPFISVLMQPEKLYQNPHFDWFVKYLDIASPQELIIVIAVIFFTLTILSGFLRITLLWGNTRLSHAIGLDLSIKVLHNYLNQPYYFYVETNTSSIITTVTTRINNVIYSTIFPMCTLISSLVILTIILAGLILLEPTVGFISIFLFGAFYFSMGYFSKKRLSILGSNVNFQAGYLVRLMQEAFGGIRDIILERLQSQYSSAFSKAEFEMRYAQGSMQIIGQAPRYVIETIGTIGIILIALYLARLSDNADTSIFLPILAVIALGAQRLLPILQQIYYNFTLLRSGGAALREVNEVLKLNNAIPYYLPTFLKPVFGDIKFQNLNFKFKGGTVPIFNNVNLEIERGEVVGIIGKTGEGKSTFLDLLMGLLEPTAGSIYVDHVKLEKNNTLAWQKSIAHVPQTIFLADKTIYENIAFGFNQNEIDYIRLQEVAKLTKVCEFVDSLPEKFNTVVGERGARLSGGQRQRIGIARALYRLPNVLILDEATSALDTQTENNVLEEIMHWRSGITIIMVTHRISSLIHCTKIHKIDKGCIVPVDIDLLKNQFKTKSLD